MLIPGTVYGSWAKIANDYLFVTEGHNSVSRQSPIENS